MFHVRCTLRFSRYDSVVDALHEKQQNACPHCGQRMELRGERYERHLDWHVKRNLKTFEKACTSRPWYASSKVSEDMHLCFFF